MLETSVLGTETVQSREVWTTLFVLSSLTNSEFPQEVPAERERQHSVDQGSEEHVPRREDASELSQFIVGTHQDPV